MDTMHTWGRPSELPAAQTDSPLHHYIQIQKDQIGFLNLENTLLDQERTQTYPSLQFVSPGAGGLSSLATCVQTPSYNSHCLVLDEHGMMTGIPNKPGRFFCGERKYASKRI